MTPFHRNPRVLVPVLLTLLVLSVFGQTVRHDFISFDDVQYVLENQTVSRGLTLDGVAQAFSGPMVANYHPLTILSHMIDVSIFGISPAWHHAMNVVLHLLASIALFRLVEAMVASGVAPSASPAGPWSMTGSSSVGLLVASLFAIHPLHVEPVAWVSSRKDLLCALFWFLSMWAWVGYAREGGRRRYALSLFFALLSMMSKPMAVTLPLTLLMLDWWPLRRIAGSWTRAVVEKVPFLIVSAATSMLTVVMQEKGGALVGSEELLASDRLFNAFVSYGVYMTKTVWPSGLAVFYQHPSLLSETGLPVWRIVLSIIFLVGVSTAAWRERVRRPHLLFGWMFFVVTLLPAIGIVQVGSQAMADRYSYVPLIGIFIALVVEGLNRLAGLGESWRCTGKVAMAVGILALAVVSFRQTALWRDGEVLYRHSIAVTGPNPAMHRILGEYLIRLNRYDDSRKEFAEAVRYRPKDTVLMNWLAVAETRSGNLEEAEAILRRAIGMDPGLERAWYNLGVVFLETGDMAGAVEAERRLKALGSALSNRLALEIALLNEPGGTITPPTESNARKDNDAWRR